MMVALQSPYLQHTLALELKDETLEVWLLGVGAVTNRQHLL